MKVLDLTYPIEEGMLTFQAPWHPPVAITQLARIGLEGRETRQIVLGTHTGTHMDAPLHFIKNGGTIDQIPLSKLIGEVTILDFSRFKQRDVITKEDLEPFHFGKKVIFRFNWGRYWGTKLFYTDWPSFTKDAANYLLERGVELVGMDTPSPDGVGNMAKNEEDSPVHKILLGSGVILLEYLANLGEIDDLQGWTLIALPLNIAGADGAPARVCLCKREGEDEGD